MARWPRGEAEIERLLGLRHLQTITGAAADGQPLLAKAGRTLATADSITSTDRQEASPGGHSGATLQSSATGSTPTTSSSDKSLPRPARLDSTMPQPAA